jgi:hypothetical protein
VGIVGTYSLKIKYKGELKIEQWGKLTHHFPDSELKRSQRGWWTYTPVSSMEMITRACTPELHPDHQERRDMPDDRDDEPFAAL